MPELRFIIADRLPERELDYLKQNIRPEPDLKLVVTGKNNANRRAEFSLFPPEESVLISTDGHIISNMDQLGMATLGYIGPGGAENESTGEVPDDVITEIGSQNVNCNDTLLTAVMGCPVFSLRNFTALPAKVCLGRSR